MSFLNLPKSDREQPPALKSKKPGRPPKPEKAKRKTISVYLTEEEFKLLDDRRERCPRSIYIRDLVKEDLLKTK